MKKCLVVLVIFILSAQLFSKKLEATYFNYSEMTQHLKMFAVQHSDILSLESLGSTIGNKDVWSLTISKGENSKKPALLIVGGVEGADVAASEMCLRFVDHVVTNYSTENSIKQIVDNYTLYILPRVNPDASEAFWSTVKYERLYNHHPMDLDYDGEFDEDGYDDLNGDGKITLMRITDPAGEWIVDSENPELLRKADRTKGEQGVYKVLKEGFDNDKDGLFNEDEPGGVNFNQNFAFNYQFFVPGAGVYQMSEIESKAVADFCFGHPNIAVVFSFSRDGNLINPWKPKKSASTKGGGRQLITTVQKNDAKILDEFAEKYKSITGIKAAEKTSKINGNFNEWAYYHFGRWSVSAPAWLVPVVKEKPDSSKVGDEKKQTSKEDPISRERNLLKWLKKSSLENNIIQWQPITHPDFSDQIVEVGGFAPFVTINPPADSLAVIAEKHNQFLLWLAEKLPRIKIAETKMKKLSPGLFRLTARIKNVGFLSTNSELGRKVQWARKVKVDLELENGLVIQSGRKMQLVDSIAGSGGVHELSWIISGKKGKIKIFAGSPMAGFDSKDLELK